jgi:hypothetical protein
MVRGSRGRRTCSSVRANDEGPVPAEAVNAIEACRGSAACVPVDMYRRAPTKHIRPHGWAQRAQ